MNCGLGCNLALFLKLYPRTQEAPKYGRAWSHWQKALSRSMIKDKEKRRDVGTVMVCSYGGDSHKQSSCLRTHMSGCTQCWEDRYPLLWMVSPEKCRIIGTLMEKLIFLGQVVQWNDSGCVEWLCTSPKKMNEMDERYWGTWGRGLEEKDHRCISWFIFFIWTSILSFPNTELVARFSAGQKSTAPNGCRAPTQLGAWRRQSSGEAHNFSKLPLKACHLWGVRSTLRAIVTWAVLVTWSWGGSGVIFSPISPTLDFNPVSRCRWKQNERGLVPASRSPRLSRVNEM